jgi:hypothetical protein
MANPHSDIRVQLHYIAATKPFKNEYGPETKLTIIKADALNAFELVEDSTKSYKLFSHKVELSNLDATIGSIADNKQEIVIDLEEFITQGCDGR